MYVFLLLRLFPIRFCRNIYSIGAFHWFCGSPWCKQFCRRCRCCCYCYHCYVMCSLLLLLVKYGYFFFNFCVYGDNSRWSNSKKIVERKNIHTRNYNEPKLKNNKRIGAAVFVVGWLVLESSVPRWNQSTKFFFPSNATLPSRTSFLGRNSFRNSSSFLLFFFFWLFFHWRNFFLFFSYSIITTYGLNNPEQKIIFDFHESFWVAVLYTFCQQIVRSHNWIQFTFI